MGKPRTQAGFERQQQALQTATNGQENKIRKFSPASTRRAVEQSKSAKAQTAIILNEFRKCWKNPPVTSNVELLERIDSYFEMCQERELPPTIEEISLYVGYSTQTWRDWRTGRNKGFLDAPNGLSTSWIVNKVTDVLCGLDGHLAMKGQINPVISIFRSCNFYGLQQRNTVEVVPVDNDPLRKPLTAEQIAENLPEIEQAKLY